MTKSAEPVRIVADDIAGLEGSKMDTRKRGIKTVNASARNSGKKFEPVNVRSLFIGQWRT